MTATEKKLPLNVVINVTSHWGEIREQTLLGRNKAGINFVIKNAPERKEHEDANPEAREHLLCL